MLKKFLPNTPCQIGWLITLLIVWWLSGCTGPTTTAAFTENGVEVTLTLIEEQDQVKVEALFAPTEPNYHLYSIDLPEKGIDGVGRPTKVEIISDNAAVSGPITADQPIIETPFEGFSAPFPLYPDGPVTLSIPVFFDDGAADQPLELAVSYIACSSAGVCKPLVSNYPVVLAR